MGCGGGINNGDELLALRVVLFFSKMLRVTVVQILGDSKVIVDWCNGGGRLQVEAFLGWKDRVKDLMS